jgi:hypothetical protein
MKKDGPKGKVQKGRSKRKGKVQKEREGSKGVSEAEP